MKNKFAEQLSLALDRHKESTQQQVADGTHISPGQLSRLKNGSRNTDPQIRKSLANKINDFWLKYSGARENFGVLSFQNDRRLKGDMFSALMRQKKEQQEREAMEAEFENAIAINPNDRTPAQQLVIERYPREYAEEISAEITDLAKKAEYAGISMDKLQEVIDKVNRKNG
ncbi:transcriptional regulator [Lactiplantibacillus pentosus]|uniref:Transcriptional regulator n=1 Tax=Lactiplantibacillus pentosus TaxID=1589 RepID=A0AAW8VQL0_LACPE|nr:MULTISPECIES: transcriptional regulator [Lactiplantibacillus]MBU7474851.1 transcriptional regulator [Lactiplantibacillus pentosus]MBU7529397.1 transcriptional regulator [Lactiplantibacillus pentosus]MDT6988873.1 transcriptional regulator [Lactiplantibacillus pentosus]UJL25312.1 transcriptional regulator [Lactiplantibacillus plantarum]